MGGVEKKWDETECRVIEKREKREERREKRERDEEKEKENKRSGLKERGKINERVERREER